LKIDLLKAYNTVATQANFQGNSQVATG